MSDKTGIDTKPMKRSRLAPVRDAVVRLAETAQAAERRSVLIRCAAEVMRAVCGSTSDDAEPLRELALSWKREADAGPGQP